VLFATPFVRELRAAVPEAKITFGVGRHSRPAIETNPHVDALLDTGPVGSGPSSSRDFLTLANEIRARRFDACFTLERSAVIGLIPLLAGIPRRIGIDSGGRGLSHNVRVSARPARPESELYLDLLRAIGGKPTSSHLEYHPSAAARSRVEALVREQLPSDRPFALLHCAGGSNPGMVLARKRWPARSFAQLAHHFVAAGVTPVLVGGPDDREIAEAVQRAFETLRSNDRAPSVEGAAPIVDLVGRLSLDDLAALAQRALVYVGNDSGPTHLAEAAGANVVMLFGPSDPIVYGPRSRNSLPVTAGLWCSPCFVDGRVAPCANVICMESISVDRVWSDVSGLIGASAARSTR
jgi:ADP-heptose:LPS heptosyltransferase